MAWERGSLGTRWPGNEVAWEQGSLGVRWPGNEVAWERGGLGTRWPGNQVAWERGGPGTRWTGNAATMRASNDTHKTLHVQKRMEAMFIPVTAMEYQAFLSSHCL